MPGNVAEIFAPSRKLKERVGSGGLDMNIINKAQQQLETNTIDFKPIGSYLLSRIDTAAHDIRSGKLRGKEAVRNLLYPVMELKAQGAMFHYPLITDISSTLITLLEAQTDINTDVLTLMTGYKLAITAIFTKDLRGTGGVAGQELRTALSDAYDRFYKTLS